MISRKAITPFQMPITRTSCPWLAAQATHLVLFLGQAHRIRYHRTLAMQSISQTHCHQTVWVELMQSNLEHPPEVMTATARPPGVMNNGLHPQCIPASNKGSMPGCNPAKVANSPVAAALAASMDSHA